MPGWRAGTLGETIPSGDNIWGTAGAAYPEKPVTPTFPHRIVCGY